MSTPFGARPEGDAGASRTVAHGTAPGTAGGTGLDPARVPLQRRDDDTTGHGHDEPRDGVATDPAAQGGGGRLRLLLVGSSGGHLAQLTALDPWSRDHDRHWVCFDTPDALSILAGEQVTWAYHPTTRHVPNLLRNLVLAWRVLRRERPDVVLSTGAGVAVPFFVLARLAGIPTVFLEVYDRLDTATLTGRLCRPFASRMLVQWDEQRALYRDAEVVGCVL